MNLNTCNTEKGEINMRVIRDNRTEVDCYVGDIIKFNGYPCMVIDMGEDSEHYGVLALEGADEGSVVATFEALHHIDKDERTTSLWIGKSDVVIGTERDFKCQS